MKIALVHDYLIEAGGAERVLMELSRLYPEAPIYVALAKNGSAKNVFANKRVIESKWAPILRIGRMYSYLRFLLPFVWKSIDLSSYDLVITSCSGYIARGFKVSRKTRVVAYCHTPPRWLYGYDTPTGANKKWWGQAFMWIIGPALRYFDYQSAQRVDKWIVNSNEVAKRVKKFYRKDSVVIYPPIAIAEHENKNLEYRNENKYYLMISRIVGGKGIEIASSAFKKLNINLKIVGEVVDTKLGLATQSLGRVDDSELSRLYVNAKGFVAMSRDEDFGMTVVESMSYGTPVLAYNGGGYRETVVPGKTGVLINDFNLESIKAGIEEMESTKWDKKIIKNWAARFGVEVFDKKIREVIDARTS